MKHETETTTLLEVYDPVLCCNTRLPRMNAPPVADVADDSQAVLELVLRLFRRQRIKTIT